MRHLHQDYDKACQMKAKDLLLYFECFMDELDLIFSAFSTGIGKPKGEPITKEFLANIPRPESWVMDKTVGQ